MVSTDPISDMLTRIRNAILVNKSEVSLPYSKLKHGVADILAENNFIDLVSVSGEKIDKKLVIKINSDGTNARITEIQRMSRPGRRMYSNASNIPTIKRGRGIIILSTSRGIMSGSDAKKASIGGELICKVY